MKTWEKEKEVGQVKTQASLQERTVIITLQKAKVGNTTYLSPSFFYPVLVNFISKKKSNTGLHVRLPFYDVFMVGDIEYLTKFLMIRVRFYRLS